jgi:predicted naringenin-chalcone synthase
MKHKKFLTTFAILSLIAGCCAAMLVYSLLREETPFKKQPTSEEINASFLTALTGGDYQAAYDLCSAGLQTELAGAAGLRTEIEERGLQPAGWETLSQSISSKEVEYSGSMNFQNGAAGTFRVTLRQYEQGWRVSAFFLNH